MPKGCQTVLEGSSLLLHSTAELYNNPVSSNGRQELLEAVKGILDGTSAILEAFDEFEMRKIFNALKNTRELLKMAQSQSVTPESEAAYVHILRRTSQAFNTACRLSCKRSKDIISVALAKHLDETVMAFTKRTIHYLESCELQVQYERSKESNELFISTMKGLEKLSYTIEKLVNCKDVEDYYPALAKDISKKDQKVFVNQLGKFRDLLLNEPMAEKWKRDSNSANAECLKFISEAKGAAQRIGLSV